MLKKIIPIRGMHCRSCEILISEKLKELKEVENVHVSWKKKQAVIYAKNSINIEKIKQKIFEAGYSVGYDESKSFFSKDIEDYYSLLFSFAILYFIYSLAKAFGFSGFNVGGGNPSSLLVVLMVGLTAGISTCMALVGGLILGIAARHSDKHPEATPTQKFRPHLFFNAGRIASYFIFGGLLGLIGEAVQLNGPTLGILTIIVGLVMLTLGLQLTKIFPRFSNISITLPSSISRLLGIKKHHEKEYSHTNAIIVGALTFFLPCGFTQAMQLYAVSTGNIWQGALTMGIFALGTAPGLLGIGGLTSALKGEASQKFFRFTGALVLILALFNISNGFTLAGFSSPFAKSQESAKSGVDPNVTLENGVQVVKMDQTSRGYSPRQFTIQKGTPVKWVINSKDSGSCASSIFMSKYKIRKLLTSGENVIEFTPTEVGEVKFTCSMGMYSGKFIVVEKTSSISLNSVTATATASPSPSITITSTPEPTQTATSTSAKTQNQEPASAKTSDVQIIRTTYKSNLEDISPQNFTVTAGKPVRMEISAKEDGQGCMSTIMIPGIINQPELLEKGQTIVWEFTPKAGVYDIACAMGVPRGQLIAV